MLSHWVWDDMIVVRDLIISCFCQWGRGDRLISYPFFIFFTYRTVDVILKPVDAELVLNGGNIVMLAPSTSLALDQIGELTSIKLNDKDSHHDEIRFFVVPDQDQKVLVVTDWKENNFINLHSYALT